MGNPEFQNRKEELKQVIEGDYRLLNITGETGIGKTRLMNECVSRWREAQNAPEQILRVDMQDLNALAPTPCKAFLEALIRQRQDLFSGVWISEDQFAALVVRTISLLARQSTRPTAVVLIVDTTEVIPNDHPFWDWLEKNLLRPLVSERKVKMIFCGRTPHRWQDFEVRRNAERQLRLDPLQWAENNGPAGDLARELLAGQGRHIKKTVQTQWVNIILELSFGHPMLIKLLVAYLGQHRPPAEPAQMEKQLCEQVVRPFIEDHFFQDINKDWKEILWWISVLDEFDTYMLKIYLRKVIPGKYDKEPDHFYLQGIRALHERSILKWETGRGETFQGVVGNIICKCFETVDPENYQLAVEQKEESLAEKRELEKE